MIGRLAPRLLSDARAAALVEFALVAPILLGMLMGSVQLGRIYLANAGLRNTVEDAARYATIWPRPTQTQITARMAANRFGLEADNITSQSVVFTDDSPDYVTISMTYNVTVSYVLAEQTFAFAESRRAYVSE